MKGNVVDCDLLLDPNGTIFDSYEGTDSEKVSFEELKSPYQLVSNTERNCFKKAHLELFFKHQTAWNLTDYFTSLVAFCDKYGYVDGNLFQSNPDGTLRMDATFDVTDLSLEEQALLYYLKPIYEKFQQELPHYPRKSMNDTVLALSWGNQVYEFHAFGDEFQKRYYFTPVGSLDTYPYPASVASLEKPKAYLRK